MACIDEQALIGYVEGRLSPIEAEELVAHADGCEACRELLAHVADGLVTATDSPPATAASPLLRAGAQVGPYLILEVVGRGGMGVVYSAYDPRLDRKVALKLLRADLGEGAEGHRARLGREAQAIARIAHPNVVAVHDVGMIDDRVYVAMEFVAGSTLRRWLEARPRSWREVLDVMVAAGRGLAAAHSAGLVHRDFKPDNVLVGDDGRVRVTDFGLARVSVDEAAPVDSGAPGDAPGNPVDSPLEIALTRTGSVLGTPAYMAPEQMRGEALDARADVFSFCVTLYEALFGVRPFSGGSILALERAIFEQRLSPPRSTGVPPRIRRAVLRGLSAARDDRPSSMDALLGELALDPRTARRRWAALAGAALVAGSLLVGYRHLSVERRALLCGGAEHKLDGVWDAGRRQAVRAALLGGDPPSPWADESWRSVEAALDERSARWARMYTDACQATRLRGEQSEAVLDLRMECLDQRRKELDALVGLLASDPSVSGRAVAAVHELKPLDPCENLTALRAVVRPDPETRARLEPLRNKLAQVDALHRVGSFQKSADLAAEAVKEAHALGARQLEAQALLGMAHSQGETKDAAKASRTFFEAAYAAALAHDDATAAAAWNALAYRSPAEPSGFSAAERSVQYSREAIDRLGGDDLLEARRLSALAHVLWMQTRYDEAGDLDRRALALVEHDPRATDYDRMRYRTSLADSLGDQGLYEEAAALEQQALAECKRLLGPHHPIALSILDSLAISDYDQGRYAQAIAQEREVVSTMARLHDAGAVERVATQVNNLGWMLTDGGKPDEAIGVFERAIADTERSLGADSIELSWPLTGLAYARLTQHRPELAMAPAERALKLQAAPELERSSDRAETEFILAQALAATGGDAARARSLAAHARQILAVHVVGERRRQVLKRLDAWLAAHRAP